MKFGFIYSNIRKERGQSMPHTAFVMKQHSSCSLKIYFKYKAKKRKENVNTFIIIIIIDLKIKINVTLESSIWDLG